MKPTEVLVSEHNAVLLALQILEKIGIGLENKTSEAEKDLDQLIDFFRGFVDRCHHAKEEEVLFPDLQKRGVPREGGPIGVMLAEHDEGRRHVQAMSEALAQRRSGDGDAVRDIRESSADYRNLLQEHIEKENNVLFPLADRLIPAGDAAKMVEQFEEIERNRVGVGKHEAYHSMLHRLKEAYRI